MTSAPPTGGIRYSSVPAEESRLPAIMILERSGFVPAEQWSERAWLSELAGPAFRVLLATEADRAVGVIALRLAGDGCELDRLIVSREHRRQGVGSRLVRDGLQLAAASGATEMILDVASDNHPADALYRRCGFAPVTVRRDYYGPGRDAMIMKRLIGEQR